MQAYTKINLNGSWKMRKLGDEQWLDARVPGSVFADLLRNERIADPFYRDNEDEALEIAAQDYEYRHSFEATGELLRHDKVYLVCRGLDTLAEIRVNGRWLAKTDNMHRTYRLDVKDWLVEGDNELHIRFDSALNHIRRRHAERRVWNQFHTLDGFSQLRKASYMFGWDWGPILPDAGIWRDIELEGYSVCRIADLRINQEHRQDQATVRAVVALERLTGNFHLTLEATLTSPDGQTFADRIEVSPKPGDPANSTLSFDISNPQLWWPNGYGEQPLYALQVKLLSNEQESLLDDKSLSIGLRTIRLRQEDDEWGRSFEFVVNGVPIFVKGANYIPEDSLQPHYTEERTERLIRDCTDVHMNLLRVWGGGTYAADHLYDLCDRYGLIVWQDFMFACAAYALDDPFRETIREEAADNIRRLRHHACLGLWCGNNEVEMAWVDWGIPQVAEHKRDYTELFERLLPEQVSLNDPNTAYWPSSPSSGGGFDAPSDPNRGDVHYWDVWHGLKPFSDYRKHHFRFVSEFGFQSFPDLKTIESFTLPEDRNIFSYVMEKHQKNDAANGKILYYLSELLPYPKDLSALIYASQLLQAEAIKCGVEHWRRERGRCMGAIYWQLNDCWPVASWSSIDYYGRWKALHYFARRFYAPLLISIDDRGTEAGLIATNDTREAVRGIVRWSIRDHTTAITAEGETQLDIPPLSAKEAAVVPYKDAYFGGKQKRKHYLVCSLEFDGRRVSDNVLLAVPPKHFEWIASELRLSVEEQEDRFEIEVSSPSFVRYVELKSDLDGITFSDNLFDLAEGAPRTVYVHKAAWEQAPSKDEFQRSLSVRSLADIAARP